jgi:hypothetical protein
MKQPRKTLYGDEAAAGGYCCMMALTCLYYLHLVPLWVRLRYILLKFMLQVYIIVIRQKIIYIKRFIGIGIRRKYVPPELYVGSHSDLAFFKQNVIVAIYLLMRYSYCFYFLYDCIVSQCQKVISSTHFVVFRMIYLRIVVNR